jgi:hypothetical protein
MKDAGLKWLDLVSFGSTKIMKQEATYFFSSLALTLLRQNSPKKLGEKEEKIAGGCIPLNFFGLFCRRLS